MGTGNDKIGRRMGDLGRRYGVRLECRQCGLICERVVSPWRCLKARHACIYAFEEGDTTYFGCLYKVFSPELDLGAFAAEGGHADARIDPYGPIRVVRSPRPQCPVTIERAYAVRPDSAGCSNPDFFCGAGILGRQDGGRPPDASEDRRRGQRT